MNAESRTQAETRARPRSAVSTGVGLAGLAGLFGWIAVARAFGMDGSWSALIGVAACGVPMVLWSLLVDRVHRNPTTGIDWDRAPRPLRDTLDISLVKLAGLWATWGLIAVVYCVGRWYWRGGYLFAMELFAIAAPALLVISIPYVLWLDRRLIEPRDGAWAFGRALIGGGVDRAAIADHLRAWAVKGFFLAFMVSIVPPGFADIVRASFAAMTPVDAVFWLITLMFVVDVAFATVGYLLTMRPLDAHIRSANPYAAGWTAALICYPPFILMRDGGPLDYFPGTAGDHAWTHWLAGAPALMAIWSAALIALTFVYAWATVAFGLRFSNLTHRGILTHGPYAWTKHPAYLSKNAFWWLSTLPFLATSGSAVDAIRNSAILAVVSGVYYWRALTEEKHLSTDPAYVAYADWIAREGVWSRLRRRTGRSSAPLPAE